LEFTAIKINGERMAAQLQTCRKSQRKGDEIINQGVLGKAVGINMMARVAGDMNSPVPTRRNLLPVPIFWRQYYIRGCEKENESQTDWRDSWIG
jgi:hypothetical protein